jgi:hypothetical protein
MLGEELNVAEFRRSAGENGSAFVDRLLDERMAPNLGSDLPIVRPFGLRCAPARNCNTVARWPAQRHVSRTT